MPVIEPAIRPPSEADSFLLQVTLGCSSNQCSFCGAYQGKEFKVKDTKEIFEDIRREAKINPFTRRVFLMDGDALAVADDMLSPILRRLRESFPSLARISSYANGYNITKRSDSQLLELYENKLRLVYVGLESGSQDILNACRKRSSVEEMIEGVKRAQAAGIKSSVIVLLGLGGRDYSKEHVAATITALNRMQPRYLSFLSLMVIPGTEMHLRIKRGEFKQLNPNEILQEARDIIAGLELDKTIFRSNHASNYLALEGRFPQDKEKILGVLQSALTGDISLRPEFTRGL